MHYSAKESSDRSVLFASTPQNGVVPANSTNVEKIAWYMEARLTTKNFLAISQQIFDANVTQHFESYMVHPTLSRNYRVYHGLEDSILWENFREKFFSLSYYEPKCFEMNARGVVGVKLRYRFTHKGTQITPRLTMESVYAFFFNEDGFVYKSFYVDSGGTAKAVDAAFHGVIDESVVEILVGRPHMTYRPEDTTFYFENILPLMVVQVSQPKNLTAFNTYLANPCSWDKQTNMKTLWRSARLETPFQIMTTDPGIIFSGISISQIVTAGSDNSGFLLLLLSGYVNIFTGEQVEREMVYWHEFNIRDEKLTAVQFYLNQLLLAVNETLQSSDGF